MALVLGGRWLRPKMVMEPLPEVSVMGNSTVIENVASTVDVTVTTSASTYLNFEPGDVVELTLPGSEPALFTLTWTRNYGRMMALRKL